MKEPRLSTSNAPLLRLHIEGAEELDGDVRLGAFIEKLAALRAALSETDHLLHKGAPATTDYLVSELSHSSPAMIGLTAIPLSNAPQAPARVVAEFLSFLDGVRNRTIKEVTSNRAKLVGHLRRLVSGAGERFERIWIDGPNVEAIELDQAIAEALDEALPDVRRETGAVKGVVKRYSGVGKQPYFKIVPPAGAVEIKCVFPHEILADAAASVERNATVEGELKFYDEDFWPHEVRVTKIVVHPKDEELPLLQGLAGAAPNATGNESASEFVRRLRNEW